MAFAQRKQEPHAMRFEVMSAFVLGVAIPVLETARRGLAFENVTTLVEDYLIGLALVAAGGACVAGWRTGGLLLVIAWALLAGGLFPSFFGHLESLLRGSVSGTREALIVAVKGLLFAVGLLSLVRAARRTLEHPAASR
jgi:hypothetical protein